MISFKALNSYKNTDVDAVTGAIVSSRNLRRAVIDALLKAGAVER